RRLPPLRIAAPVEVAARHVGAVAHAEEQGAVGPVDVFVQFARRGHHERARHDVDGLPGRAHLAAALETEIDLRRLRMAVIGADLSRLPAGDRGVAFLDLAEDLLDVLLGIPGLLLDQIEDLHWRHLPFELRPGRRPRTGRATIDPASPSPPYRA